MSRFRGKLVLVLLDQRGGPSLKGGRSLWAVQRPLCYQAGENPAELITVPAGFVTDLASVPRPVWSVYPPDGPWVKAAVVHDFLYDTCGTGVWNGRIGITRDRPYSRSEADHILREAMADRGIGRWEQAVIWMAVRVGGRHAWTYASEGPVPRQSVPISVPSKRK